jgi:hypothetical protein
MSKIVYNTSAGKPELKTSLGKGTGTWKDNIKMAVTDIVCEGVNCIHLHLGFSGDRRVSMNLHGVT